MKGFTIDLSGKNAIVTGASRGLGQAIAIGLAEAGATVVITSRFLKHLRRHNLISPTLEVSFDK